MASNVLAGFAYGVTESIAHVPEGGRFGRKVFVSAIWEVARRGPGKRQSLAQFKANLFAAHRASLLTLCRADLVAAMPPAHVAASEINHHGITFHFVVDANARDPWQ